MAWTAIVALKAGAEQKSRLAGHLPPDARAQLLSALERGVREQGGVGAA